jgi:hypothetical protein
MCLVLLWKMGLAVMWRAAWESQNNKAEFEIETWRYLCKEKTHISSQQATVIVRYSASANEQDTVCCFLDFQDIRESPWNKQQNPITYFLVSGQPAQSASQKDFNLKS